MSSDTDRSFWMSVVVAIIVIALGAMVLLWLLSWLGGVIWFLIKLAILVLLVYGIVRLLTSRRR